MKTNIAVVIPNWNGKDTIGHTLDSLLAQTQPAEIVVVENGSVDGSLEYLKQKYPGVTIIENTKNLGFAGGVNTGIRHAMHHEADYVALFNNDAVADKNWLRELTIALEAEETAGIATCQLLNAAGTHFDSTGELYTNWGLPFPRGRGEAVNNHYDSDTLIFGASGGASLYRITMLKEIGLFDEDFFAYYEDVDLSFRAQLAGWKVLYVPKAVAYHQIGATSSKIKGFTTYQTMKNLPMVVRRNVPTQLLPAILPRFWLAYSSFFFSAVVRGQVWPAFRGWCLALVLLPKNFIERRSIQKNRKASVSYIRSIITYDLPPNAHRLRLLRAKWWQLRRKAT